MTSQKELFMPATIVRTVIPLAPLLALALAGCGTPASDHPAAHPPTPSRAVMAPPTTAADAAIHDALAAYRAMWADFAAAGVTSDWRSPALGAHATGLALSTLSRGLYADHDNGLITRGEPVLHPSVSSASPPSDPTMVMITDCGDSTHALKFQAATGQPANDGPGGRRLINATVQKQPDGSWKVTDFGVQAVGTC